MDIVLGIRVQDSTIIATSKAATRGISVLKTTDDKTRALNTHNLLAYTGEAGDTVQFAEYIQANIQLYTMRENDIELSPKATASFVRNELATSIRSRKPFQVNVLLGGFDPKTNTPSLNWIDYLGTQVELPYAAHGHYRPDMKLEEGLELLKLSLKELETRMPIDFKGVYVKVVDKDGIRDVAEY
ncbi:glutamate-5-semialdehyde dehydrogenase [Cerrena zonata]|uniref:Proteasome subunit beta n=1 Tax=Cerrena zonata TaxID=2478898 RepID=A0AAW0FGC8_9APHY